MGNIKKACRITLGVVFLLYVPIYYLFAAIGTLRYIYFVYEYEFLLPGLLLLMAIVLIAFPKYIMQVVVANLVVMASWIGQSFVWTAYYFSEPKIRQGCSPSESWLFGIGVAVDQMAYSLHVVVPFLILLGVLWYLLKGRGDAKNGGKMIP